MAGKQRKVTLASAGSAQLRARAAEAAAAAAVGRTSAAGAVSPLSRRRHTTAAGAPGPPDQTRPDQIRPALGRRGTSHTCPSRNTVSARASAGRGRTEGGAGRNRTPPTSGRVRHSHLPADARAEVLDQQPVLCPRRRAEPAGAATRHTITKRALCLDI